MRRKNDAYYSAQWMTDRLLDHVHIGGRVLEPCCGRNDIAFPLMRAGLAVDTNDLDELVIASTHGDYLARVFLTSTGERYDWVVTNPPFKDAMAFLKKALQESTCGAALQLRLTFLEPTKDRVEFLRLFPPTTVIVLPRYSFTGDGKSDSVTTAWMVWDKRPPYTQKLVIAPRIT
jgi:hypothetical protein